MELFTSGKKEIFSFLSLFFFFFFSVLLHRQNLTLRMLAFDSEDGSLWALFPQSLNV